MNSIGVNSIGVVPKKMVQSLLFLENVKILLKLEKVRIFSAFCIYFDVSNMTKQNKY